MYPGEGMIWGGEGFRWSTMPSTTGNRASSRDEHGHWGSSEAGRGRTRARVEIRKEGHEGEIIPK